MLHTILRELRARGHRVTPQRVAIIAELLSRDDHPSAETLYEAIVQRYPMVALSTVYDTVRLLTRLGLASQVAAGPAEARYDPETGAHCHAICRRCGEITNIAPEVDLNDLALRAGAAAPTFRPESISLNLHGICAACAEQS